MKVKCWNCEFVYEDSGKICCPRCGERKSGVTAKLFDTPEPSPIFFEATDTHQAVLEGIARKAIKKYKELLKTGLYPHLMLLHSYVQGRRGWIIEFEARKLGDREYLITQSIINRLTVNN
ncbi:MAG: hypothetical protein JO370_16720 [Paucibacter sp.]|nr:hypothetical protein [Roseateles sp.]